MKVRDLLVILKDMDPEAAVFLREPYDEPAEYPVLSVFSRKSCVTPETEEVILMS